jgi:ribonucleoside-diphosphate reductase alpha chain
MDWVQNICKEIFQKKYMQHGESNENEVFDLIAKEVSSTEKNRSLWKNKFYDIMSKRLFIPAGRILANARPNSKLKNYNNCFTIDIEDSMESITQSVKDYMTILKQGGGVGFNISKLRPRRIPLSTGGVSSGPLSFLEIFDQASQTIEVGGQRRGASICILNVDHPDIEEFITFKRGDANKRLTQFNISVGITDQFIEAVNNDQTWDLKFEGRVHKTVKARDLYNMIVKNAYLYNEPGIFNLSIVNRYNNGYYLYDIQTVNPCGEIAMPEYGVCCLGALNLPRFVKDPFSDSPSIDYKLLEEVIADSVRFLDDVLDVTDYPLPQIKERSQNERRIGLGITGLGDMFAMLKVEYGSAVSKEITEELFRSIRNAAYTASFKLAEEKSPFPKFDSDKILKSNFTKNLPKSIRSGIKDKGLRNIAILTIAPTGTTSFSVGQNCSSGIEPIFALEYDRNIKTDNNEIKKERVYDYAWLQYLSFLENNGFAFSDTPSYFKTAFDVNSKDAIDIQSIAQKYIDNSISKTLNIPETYSKKDYENLFLYAYEKELKGFTSFRLGSMQGVLDLSNSSHVRPKFIERADAPKRPETLPCDIHEITVNKERHIVLVGKLQGTLYEIFVTNDPENKIERIGKKEGIIKKVKKGQYQLIIENGEEKIIFDNIAEKFDNIYASLSRFISMSLRHGVNLQFIVTQLQKDKNFLGFEKAVARVLKKYIKDGEKVLSSQKCESCGAELVFREGCVACIECGWSKCG